MKFVEEWDKQFQGEESKFDKPRAARGSSGLTKYGGKMVRSSCQLLEELAAGRAIGFLTLTIPTNERKKLILANKSWSEIMRQFNQELTRELTRHNLPDKLVYVTEWQKRGALHAHIGFVASHQKKIKHPVTDYPILKTWYKDTWQRILKNVLGQEFDCKAATRIEKVKQSTGAYFSKYISKGERPGSTRPPRKLNKPNADMNADINADMNADMSEPPVDKSGLLVNHLLEDVDAGMIPEYDSVTGELVGTRMPHPSAWWGATTSLKKIVTERIERWEIKVNTGIGKSKYLPQDEWLVHAQRIIDKQDTYWKKIVHSGDGVPRAIAGRLKLKPMWKEEALATIFGEKIKPDYFRKTDAYWKWRVRRDGAIPEQNESAEIEWVIRTLKGVITYPYESKKVRSENEVISFEAFCELVENFDAKFES